MLDPTTLPGLPAPLWFILFFKIVGFVLHVLMMNLWLAGLPIALLCFFSGSENAHRWGKRFFQQLPIIVAFGINFGIVPLLFIQTLFYKPFYTGTILMAWPWLMVLLWVMTAYYSIYIVAFAAKSTDSGIISRRRIRVFGLIATGCLLMAGITMSTGLTYMAESGQWLADWHRTEIGAAVTGTLFPVHNWAVLCRFGSMFGIAMLTTSIWVLLDAFWFIGAGKNESDESYRAWSLKFAGYAGLIGAALVTVVYNYYLSDIILSTVYASLRKVPFICVTGLSAGVFLLPVVLISLTKLMPCKRAMVLLVALAQVGAIAVYAVVRQWIQYLEVSQWLDVAKIPETTQWSPLIAFVVIFVLGLAICVWIVSRCIIAAKKENI